jgi:hypothetical protein
MRYRSARRVPGSKRPSDPEEENRPEDDGVAWLRGRRCAAEGGRAGAPPADVAASSNVVGCSANATAAPHAGQNRAVSGTGW